MKILIALAAIGLSSAAFAQAEPITLASLDTDTSGSVSLVEAQVLWPDLTQELFEVADISKDGTLAQTEFDAYVATLPAA